MYKVLRDLCYPLLPKDKTFEELVELLNKQYIKQKSVFRERVKFYAARQYATEPISNWFVRIKKLSVDCKFGNKFDDVLLDRFISGLRPSPILDRLCQEEDTLTLKEAVEIAVNKEICLKWSGKGEEDIDSQEGGNKRRQKDWRNKKTTI